MSGGIRPKGDKSYAATRSPEAAEALRKDQPTPLDKWNIDPPAGSFPDDTPCPQCGYPRLTLMSHGEVLAECPKCGWFTKEHSMPRPEKKEPDYETCNCVGCM